MGYKSGVETASNQRFTNNYDLLRIVAALCIAFTHSFNLLGKNSNEPLMAISGGRFDFSFIGLCIFFTISGYLIAKSANTSRSFVHYLWKRFLRIQPLLIVVCILCVFILGPCFTSLGTLDYFTNSSTYSYFRNIFPATGIQFTLPGVFDNNKVNQGVNGSLWTLVIEERLYLLVSVLYFLKKGGKKWFVFFVIIINILFFANQIWSISGPLKYFASVPVFYALVFLNSSLAYILHLPVKRIAALIWVVFLGLLIAGCIWVKPLEPLLVVAGPVFILSVANMKGITNKAGIFGDFTYGIYIFSFPVQQILISLLNGSIAPFLLFVYTICIVLPMAVISWHFIEKRMLGYKDRVG